MQLVPFKRRITVFMGHYGSGKTTVAVNAALAIRAQGHAVTVADLDVVNPYFRTADSRGLLERAGVRLVASPYAGGNLDIPALPKELYDAILDESAHAVLDVGGDDRGAVALGRFAPQIVESGDYEAAFTVNFLRPLTQTPEAALEVLREVERAGGLPCTALVNNTNLGAETAAVDVLAGAALTKRLSQLCGLPVWMTAAREELCGELLGRVPQLFLMKHNAFAAW